MPKFIRQIHEGYDLLSRYALAGVQVELACQCCGARRGSARPYVNIEQAMKTRTGDTKRQHGGLQLCRRSALSFVPPQGPFPPRCRQSEHQRHPASPPLADWPLRSSRRYSWQTQTPPRKPSSPMSCAGSRVSSSRPSRMTPKVPKSRPLPLSRVNQAQEREFLDNGITKLQEGHEKTKYRG